MDLKRLTELITQSGIKRKKIAEELHITEGSLRNKISGRTRFSWNEVQVLTRILHLSPADCEAVFFSPEVAGKATEEV